MYSAQDFDIIKNAILDEIMPSRIILFGSYATNNQTAASDIDIMILMQEEISRKEKLELLYRIEKRFLNLKYPIDVILKSQKQYEMYRNYTGTISYDVSRQGRILWMKQ
jgi:predicted nucleotidyltransferase